MNVHIKSLLAKLNLLVPLTHLKYLWHRYQLKSSNAQFKREHPDFVLPPDFLLYESYGLNYQHYYSDGKATAALIKEKTQAWLPNPSSPTILDWGCGPARVLRHLPEQFEGGQFFGCDYNPETVSWLKSALPALQVEKNQLHPPLPWEANRFDMVYGISIFTHLSATGHQNWLQEIHRVLKPGGIFLFTTHGSAFLPRLTSAEKQEFLAGKLVIRASGPEGHRVYGAFHPEEAIRRLLPPFEGVSVELHAEGGDFEQDWWLVRKAQ